MASALAFVLGTGIASADGTSIRYGQGSCNYNSEINNDTGRSIEFYGEADTYNDSATVGFKYVIEFQKEVTRVDPCVGMQRIATQSMQLDLEVQRLELELLRNRIAREENEAKQLTNETPRLESEW